MNLNPNNKATSPAVSVIIPAYNLARFLPLAVQSVFKQTLQDFEVIVVDDGSTDETREVVQPFMEDGRFRYIYQENQGLSATRNTGIRAAKGKYIALLDADDTFLPHKLAVQTAWLQENDEYGMVVSGYYYMDEQGNPVNEQHPWLRMPRLETVDWLFDCPIVPHSVLVKKYWLERVGGFDTQYRRVEDWDMWIRLAHAGCKMGWVEEVIGGYRVFPGQMTRNAAAQKQVSVQVMDKFFSQPNLPATYEAQKSEIYTRLYLVCAGREYGAGQCEDAMESVVNAIKLTPALVTARQDELIDLLLSWTENPFVGDPIEYTKRVFDNLPQEATVLRQRKRWALGEIGLRAFFAARHIKDWPAVRRAGQVVAMNAPTRMCNRGVVSILWQSMKNKQPHQ